MTKINSIIIGNSNEDYYRNINNMKKSEKEYWYYFDNYYDNRILFYENDNKVLITTFPINKNHIYNTCKNLTKWNNIINITPKYEKNSICENILNQKTIINEIVKIIKENPGINIIPYKATSYFYNFIDYLLKLNLVFNIKETIIKDKYFIKKHFDTKSGFRHLWEKTLHISNIPIEIPEGFILYGKDKIIEACWWFRNQNRSFVIKIDEGEKGENIILNNHNEFSNIKEKFVIELKLKLYDNVWSTSCVVVEQMIDIDYDNLGGSPSIEFYINSEGKIINLYASTQLLEEDNKTFKGVLISPEINEDYYIKIANKAGYLFGKALSSYGYRGYFDIDLVISKDKKIYAVESNLRRTGGTHVHQLSNLILGNNYYSKYFILSEEIHFKNDYLTNYENCYEIFKDIYFDNETKKGIIFTNPDMLKINILYIIIIGISLDEINYFKNKILNYIKIEKIYIK